MFAYLAAHNGRAVPRDELAELVWGDELPATWEKALRVLMTKLRALLDECGIEGSSALTAAFGCYRLALPAGAWIDVDAAANAVEGAEAARAAGGLDEARAQASTAAELARRVFLPGEEGSWVEEQRRALREILVRALECLRDIALADGALGEAVRYAAEITELEPFRESSHRALMQAHAAAGNPAEALRVYERCRRLLADELGAYPSAESEAAYLEILRRSRGEPVAQIDPAGADAPHPGLLPPAGEEAPRLGRGKVAALVASALLLAAIGAGALALTASDQPIEILPNSLVRLDPETLEPSQVVRIGPRADLVTVAGGYVWITHGLLRNTDDDFLRDAGDRTVTRVDPSTGEARVVGGGLAPCGIAADPSGDVWVANCFASATGANVVRVDARTLEFEATWPVPAGEGYYRGMAYGGGALWVADASGAGDFRRVNVTQLNPRTGARRSIRLARHASALAWSESYGDLWMTNFVDRSVSRLHAANEDSKTFDSVAKNPGALVVEGDDAVWVADWNAPAVWRLPAAGTGRAARISLPMTTRPGGLTSVAAGAGGIWAAVPDDRAVWRIDPKTNRTTRIGLRYHPWGVAVDDEGVWVVLRAHNE